jgi:LAO/AO transport system kinase
MEIVERLLAGEVRALARSISLVEDHAPEAVSILQQVFPHTGKANVIGITGPPGAGKSSLVDGLIANYREQGNKVGVIAVDPSSAFSGGAILGDRVRMQEHATDQSVFIRSMATRGYLGGLSRATADALDLLDAAGYDPIILETVGVGQDEIDVVRTADVVCVVLVPGMGDGIQAIKAGILEIADLFVINKADHARVERLEQELKYMLSLTDQHDGPLPAIKRTIAINREGLPELQQEIEHYLTTLDRQRRQERRGQRSHARFMSLLAEQLIQHVTDRTLPEDTLKHTVQQITERHLDPYTAVERVIAESMKK